LDIFTINVLEDYLQNFEGCLLIVSHDRFFIDKLVEHTFVLEGDGKIRDFPGGYSLYREYKKEAETQEKAVKELSQKKVETEVKKTSKLTYAERIELEKLEKELAKLEEERQELMNNLNDGSLTSEQMVEISNQVGNISETIEEKEMRWLELSEKG
jgi:ABC transport system ATP-binding/permease protein